MGRCPECESWNSLVQQKTASSTGLGSQGDITAYDLASLSTADFPRIPLSGTEVNRVLGGGIVPGALILLGGDPGVGKSTLLLQMADDVARTAGSTVYVTGEESPEQIKLRADRLKIAGRGVRIIAETDLDEVLPNVVPTELLLIDSIQTMFVREAQSGPGTISQVRECTLRLLQWSKKTGVPVLIAGHVTKDGAIAGPRLLEHMVDVVLYLEGEGVTSHRILRGVKNRFGSTSEVGIFEMGDGGLSEVKNASKVFLSSRGSAGPGSVVVPTMEGTRPLLVEVQALVTPTGAPIPRRVSNGFDAARLALLTAVLSKHGRLNLSSSDVFVNVVGGLRVTEPAADLGVALAIASSLRDKPVGPDCVAVGEIGLSGELRPVSHSARRIKEAESLGFGSGIVPEGLDPELVVTKNFRVMAAANLRQAIELTL